MNDKCSNHFPLLFLATSFTYLFGTPMYFRSGWVDQIFFTGSKLLLFSLLCGDLLHWYILLMEWLSWSLKAASLPVNWDDWCSSSALCLWALPEVSGACYLSLKQYDHCYWMTTWMFKCSSAKKVALGVGQVLHHCGSVGTWHCEESSTWLPSSPASAHPHTHTLQVKPWNCWLSKLRARVFWSCSPLLKSTF